MTGAETGQTAAMTEDARTRTSPQRTGRVAAQFPARTVAAGRTPRT